MGEVDLIAKRQHKIVRLLKSRVIINACPAAEETLSSIAYQGTAIAVLCPGRFGGANSSLGRRIAERT
jgi:hypothetical protein